MIRITIEMNFIKLFSSLARVEPTDPNSINDAYSELKKTELRKSPIVFTIFQGVINRKFRKKIEELSEGTEKKHY